jgi:hypothetical protein
MYTEEDCSYFGLVLIPRNEVWWVSVSEIIGKKLLCTNIDNDFLCIYRAATDGLKKVAANVPATI